MVYRFAAVDVGTNAVQSVVAEIRGPGDFTVLENRGVITRLGEGIDRTGMLAEEALRRTLAEIGDCVRRFRAVGVQEVAVAGTSALRDARNRDEFARRLAEETGLDLRVLSAEEEAAYSFLACRQGLSLTNDEGVLVTDIGGGSTEFIWGIGDTIAYRTSLQLGSVRLTERFFRSDPVAESECVELADAIDRGLDGLDGPFPADLMVGMAGTFTTLVAVSKRLDPYTGEEVHGSSLARAEVWRQIRRYQTATIAERRQIPGLDPGRADVILAGAILVDRTMARFGIERALISDYGLSYGLLHERLAAM